MFLAHAALESGDSQADDFEDCVHWWQSIQQKVWSLSWFFWWVWKRAYFRHSSLLMMLPVWKRSADYVMSVWPGHAATVYNLCGIQAFIWPWKLSQASRFLREIPAELCEEVRMRATISRPVTAVKPKAISLQATGSYKLGQRVSHAKFGEGVVLQWRDPAHRRGRRSTLNRPALNG